MKLGMNITPPENTACSHFVIPYIRQYQLGSHEKFWSGSNAGSIRCSILKYFMVTGFRNTFACYGLSIGFLCGCFGLLFIVQRLGYCYSQSSFVCILIMNLTPYKRSFRRREKNNVFHNRCSGWSLLLKNQFHQLFWACIFIVVYINNKVFHRLFPWVHGWEGIKNRYGSFYAV
jgi:hypothetical protein